MVTMPKEQIKEYSYLPATLLPKGAVNIFMGRADDGNHFLDFGIHEGMLLIFDADASFVDGHPSCFLHKETRQLKMLRHSDADYQHAGKLIAAITYYGDE
jgi:hypothetical protein